MVWMTDLRAAWRPGRFGLLCNEHCNHLLRAKLCTQSSCANQLLEFHSPCRWGFLTCFFILCRPTRVLPNWYSNGIAEKLKHFFTLKSSCNSHCSARREEHGFEGFSYPLHLLSPSPLPQVRPIPLGLYTAGVASAKFTKSEDESLILLFLLHFLSPQLLFSSPQTTPTQLPPLSSFSSSTDKKQLFIPSSSAESLKPLTVGVGGTVEFVRQIVQLAAWGKGCFLHALPPQPAWGWLGFSWKLNVAQKCLFHTVVHRKMLHTKDPGVRKYIYIKKKDWKQSLLAAVNGQAWLNFPPVYIKHFKHWKVIMSSSCSLPFSKLNTPSSISLSL